MNGPEPNQQPPAPHGTAPATHAPVTGAADPNAPRPSQGWTPPATQQRGVYPSDPRRKSAVLACILSALPGLGQVYVGYYPRGFLHAIVVASIITILGSSFGNEPYVPLLGVFLAFFWLYNIIDAGRRAHLYNLALDGVETIEMPKDFEIGSLGGSILGGAILVVGGIIALSYTAFGRSLAWLENWWPVAPILLGLYLFAKAVMDRAQSQNGPRSE